MGDGHNMRSHFYANIFMASFESKYICPYIKEKVITFLWSIDDLFMIWIGTEEELLKFINELNQKHKAKYLISSIQKHQ